MKKILHLSVALTALVCTLASGQVFAAGKIVSTPSSVIIKEGESVNVSIALDEPIICPDLGRPCKVILSFSATDTNITVSPFPITIPQTKWHTTKTLAISVANDNLATGNKNTTLSAKAVSLSEYYSDFVVTIPITVIDVGVLAPTSSNNPPAIQQPAPTSQQSNKPKKITSTTTPTTSYQSNVAPVTSNSTTISETQTANQSTVLAPNNKPGKTNTYSSFPWQLTAGVITSLGIISFWYFKGNVSRTKASPKLKSKHKNRIVH